MSSLREIINETIYVYITEIVEIDIGFTITPYTDFTVYFDGRTDKETIKDIMNYATENLYKYYCNYDLDTIVTFLQELKNYNIVDDNEIKYVKDFWLNEQKEKQQFEIILQKKLQQKENDINKLIIYIKDQLASFTTPTENQTIFECFKHIVDNAEQCIDLDILQKCKNISDYVIQTCQENNFNEIFEEITKLQITYKYNKCLTKKTSIV